MRFLKQIVKRPANSNHIADQDLRILTQRFMQIDSHSENLRDMLEIHK